jgi:hypothetical protein
LLERCNIHLFEPDLAALFGRVRVDEIDFAGAHRFDLAAEEREAAFELVLDGVVEERTTVLHDELLAHALVVLVLHRGHHMPCRDAFVLAKLT